MYKIVTVKLTEICKTDEALGKMVTLLSVTERPTLKKESDIAIHVSNFRKATNPTQIGAIVRTMFAERKKSLTV